MSSNNKRDKLLKRIQEVIAEEIPKNKVLVFRRVLYSKLNSKGINLYKRREDKNRSLISYIANDEVDILQNAFLETLKEFNIITKKQKELVRKSNLV